MALAGAVALVVPCAMADPLEDALPPPPPRPVALDPIVVTAPRRSLPLEEAPMAVSVFPGAELDAAGVGDTMDLQHLEPSLVFKTNSRFGQPYIRGVGSDLISIGADPSVATFVDDVYQARPVSAFQDLYDVERVEVVKGPLGTLFGRNATGGALRLFTKSPGPELEADGDFTYGNFDRARLRAAVNVPLVDERLFARVSGLWSEGDGFSENVFLDEDLDDVDLWSVRGQVLALPGESFELHLRGDFTRQDDSRSLAPYPDPDCCANLGIASGGIVPDDPRETTSDVSNHVRFTSWGASADVSWRGSEFALTSITAFRRTDWTQILDPDLTNAPISSNTGDEQSDTWSEEIQLSYDAGGRFTGLLGLYFLHEDGSQDLVLELPLLFVRNQPSGDVETEAFALFGEGRVQLTPRFAASAGLRWSHEQREQDFVQVVSDPFGAIGPAGGGTLRSEDRESWNVFTPRFVLEFAPRDGLLAYFSASRGFKAGGFNTSAFQPAFDPEYLWAYELGFKANLADGRARVALAAFWYDYDDLQLLTLAPGAPVGAFPIVINAGKATLRGLEAELQTRPWAGLDLRASVAYLDAHFDEFVSLDPNNPADDPDRSGDRLPQAPELSATVRASYTWSLGRWGSLTLGGDSSYRSRMWFNPWQDSEVRHGSYALLGARLELAGREGRWSVAAFGRNLTDELYAENVIRQDPLVGKLTFWGAPRTFGVEFAGRF